MTPPWEEPEVNCRQVTPERTKGCRALQISIPLELSLRNGWMYLEKSQFQYGFKIKISALVKDNFISNMKVKTIRQVRNIESFSHKELAPADLFDMCHRYCLLWAIHFS